MAGIAVILLLLIIFLGIEGAKNAIGGLFNFIIWSLAIMIGLYLIGKLFEDRRSDAEKEADKKKRAKEAKLEAELKEKRKQENKKAWHGAAGFWLRVVLIVTAIVVALCVASLIIYGQK